MPGTGKPPFALQENHAPTKITAPSQMHVQPPETDLFHDSALQATISSQLQPDVYAFEFSFDPEDPNPIPEPTSEKTEPQYTEIPDDNERSSRIKPPPPAAGGHSAQLQQALDYVESESLALDHERLHVFTPAGDLVLIVDGSQDFVELFGEQVLLMRGNIMTHNHSSSGQSFSLADVYHAIVHGLGEDRAVGAQYRYSIQPVPGVIWNEDLWTNHVGPSSVIQGAMVQSELRDKMAVHTVTPDEVEMLFLHEVWTRVARDTGAFVYTREPWNPGTVEDT